jgi:hypothetical protein
MLNTQDTHGAILTKNGKVIGFVDGIPDQCQHDYENGPQVIVSGNLFFKECPNGGGEQFYLMRNGNYEKHFGLKKVYGREEIQTEIELSSSGHGVMGTTLCAKCEKMFSPPMF